MKNNLVDALRLVLPYAVQTAASARHHARASASRWPEGQGAEYAARLAAEAEAATHAVTAARLALADVESATKAKRKGKATDIAWVSGLGAPYTLHVAKVPATAEFQHLDATLFMNFRAAQSIANAIRAHV